MIKAKEHKFSQKQKQTTKIVQKISQINSYLVEVLENKELQATLHAADISSITIYNINDEFTEDKLSLELFYENSIAQIGLTLSGTGWGNYSLMKVDINKVSSLELGQFYSAAVTQDSRAIMTTPKYDRCKTLDKQLLVSYLLEKPLNGLPSMLVEKKQIERFFESELQTKLHLRTIQYKN
ncbi:hypothetical protein K9L97_05150 [Candidatus Woesearchaeota archaeon]|nr:hypothetical protein [Candidatus Woesearchaeota archaeon]